MQLRGFNLAISEKAMVCLFVGLSRCVSIKAFAGLWGAARWRERQWNQETKWGEGLGVRSFPALQFFSHVIFYFRIR